MPVPFLNTATGDPINFRRLIAPQPTEDVAPAAAAYSEFWSNGGPLVISPQTIEPMGVATGAARPSRLVGKLDIGNGPMSLGDADPANKALLNILANLLRKYTLTAMGSGRQRWQFAPTRVTSAAQYLAILNDNDVLPRTRFINNIISALTIEAAPGENLAVSATLQPGEFDMLGVVTQTTGSGSTLPDVRGYYGNAFELDATDKDVYIQVVDATAKTYKAKISAAASYGSDVYTYVLDQWNRVWDETGAPVGTFAEQLRFRFPTGATLTNLDVFKVPKNRATFGAAFSGVRRVISSVSTAFLVDGVETRVEGGWSVNITAPDIDRQPDTGGRQNSRVARRGPVDIVVGIEREIVNLDFQKALMNATSVALALQCQTAEVIPGGSLKPFRLMIVVPNAVPRGDTFDVAAGGRGRTESIEFDGGLPSSAYTFMPLGDVASALSVSAQVEVVAENDVTAL